MRRWYVTMTWEDWPEGGSYGTVVEADSAEEAETACKREMAECRVDGGDGVDDDDTPEYWLEHYADAWHTVDCWDVDEFITQHGR